MSRQKTIKTYCIGICGVLLTACSSINLEQQDVVAEIVPEQWRAQQADITQSEIGWSDFNNSVLAELIKNALNNSPDIQSAALSLQRAQLQFDETDRQQGIDYSLETKVGVSDGKFSDLTQSYDLTAQASYEIDFWGKKEKKLSVATLGLLNEEINLVTAHITLVASLVETYYGLVVQDQRLELLNGTLQSHIQQLRMIKARHKAGLITDIEVANKDVEIENIKARIEDLRSERQSNETRLANLQGMAPQAFELKEQSNVELPRLSLTAKTPIEVLRRRPDIQAAEASMKSSFYNFELAKDSIFPNLNLSLNSGVNNSKASDFIKGDLFTWTAAANIALLLIDSGQRERNILRSKLEAEQQVVSYRKSMLNALKEVEDALTAQASGQRQLHIAQAQLASQKRLTRETNLKYRVGSVSGFDLINQERALVDQKETILQQKLNNLNNSIRLLRALGVRPKPLS